jgi:conjugal transfer/entry exclusion protein
VTEVLTKNVKMDIDTSFFDVMSEVQKDLEDVSAGIDQIKNNTLYKNFARNLTSKLARSTLTSPS